MSEWIFAQPMQYPSHGQYVLVGRYSDGQYWIGVCRYFEDKWASIEDGEITCYFEDQWQRVTFEDFDYWMPLPEPPK